MVPPRLHLSNGRSSSMEDVQYQVIDSMIKRLHISMETVASAMTCNTTQATAMFLLSSLRFLVARDYNGYLPIDILDDSMNPLDGSSVTSQEASNVGRWFGCDCGCLHFMDGVGRWRSAVRLQDPTVGFRWTAWIGPDSRILPDRNRYQRSEDPDPANGQQIASGRRTQFFQNSPSDRVGVGMCCVYSPATASTTSSQRGQIVSSDRPPPYAADAPLRSDEGFDGRAANRSRARRRGGDGEPPPLSPTPSVNTDGKFDRAAAKRSRAGSGVGDAAAQDCGNRIGELPDAILLCILSYLPLRDAARSTALSSRWRRLFDQYLLDFNACQPFPPEAGRGCDWFIRAVDSILASRRHIRIRSFRFVMYGQGFVSRMAVVSGWFPVLAGCGVREIDVDMLYTAPKPTLPASLLQLASLETLRVCFCDLPRDAEVDALRLPALKTLRLSNVGTSQDALQAMLAHCPSLECAKLKNITGAKQIRLRSKSLVCLYGDFANMSELVVEDAPSLEELVGIHLPSSRATVKIVSAPKLQVLGYLGKNVRPLVLHDTVFDGGILQSTTLMCSVKTLAIQVPFSEKGHTIFVAQLLKCFPCLETLHVEADSRSISHQVTPESWETASSIQCIEHSINKLVFENFGGQMCQWSFLTFMLEMAKTLKVIEFYCLEGEDCASRLIQLLCTINRVCLDIKFLFFTSCEPVNGMYLCHCCPRRCQNENRVSLLPRPTKPADGYSEAPET